MIIHLIIFGVFGLLAGWLGYYLAHYLPRYSSLHNEPVTARLHPPAVFGLLRHGPRSADDRERLLVELVALAGGLAIGARFGLSLDAALYGGILVYLLLLAVIDLKYRLVLNVMVYPAIGLVVLAHLWWQPDFGPAMWLGGGLAFAVFALTAYLMPGQVGGGDVKLALLLGVAFGFPGVLWALLVGGGVGALVAVYLLTRRPAPSRAMPYAPFLCLGALVALAYNPFLGWA